MKNISSMQTWASFVWNNHLTIIWLFTLFICRACSGIDPVWMARIYSLVYDPQKLHHLPEKITN